jgi:hypothetical protein
MIGGALALAVACGGDAEPTAAPTSVPPTNTPTSGGSNPTPTTAAPTATTAPDDGGSSVPVPAPQTPDDTAVIAVDAVTDENGLLQAQATESVHYWGIGETLFLRADDDSSTPWLATGYEIASDLSGATITIREGVPFQTNRGDFGNLTAADVAFSMNNANAATNPQSVHGQAGDFNGLWGEWTAVDDTTIEFSFAQYDATWKDDFLNQSGQSFQVYSKKAFETWVKTGFVTTLLPPDHSKLKAGTVTHR